MAKGGFFRKAGRLMLKVILWFLAISIGSTILFRFVPIPVTPLMLIRVVEQISDNKKIKLKKDWESLDNISKHLPLAVIAAEDQLFMDHSGFDMKAIEKAIKHNKKKKKIKGASTISQQTAKNVFLWPGRSWLRKGFEVYFTTLIELIWGKRRIMEVYLNVIEMGDGIYGAEKASRLFYGKPAIRMSASEAAGIAAVLPNPRRWSPAKPTSYIQGRKSWILRNMNNLGDQGFD